MGIRTTQNNLKPNRGSKMIKSTLLAVATAAAALAVTIAPASAQQEWRRGNFEERQGAHNFGEFCIHRVVSQGFAHTNFFGGGGRDALRKAEFRAIKSWENRVSERFGPQFANFAQAQGKQNQCNRRGQEIECTINAHPCRHRGPGPYRR